MSYLGKNHTYLRLSSSARKISDGVVALAGKEDFAEYDPMRREYIATNQLTPTHENTTKTLQLTISPPVYQSQLDIPSGFS